MPWEDVKKEMVNEKGLSEEAADQIGEYVSMQGETFLIFTKDVRHQCCVGVVHTNSSLC